MSQISSFDNYIKRDNRRRCRNKCKNIVKLSNEIIHIKNPSIISTYNDGDQIRKLFNAPMVIPDCTVIKPLSSSKKSILSNFLTSILRPFSIAEALQ